MRFKKKMRTEKRAEQTQKQFDDRSSGSNNESSRRKRIPALQRGEQKKEKAENGKLEKNDEEEERAETSGAAYEDGYDIVTLVHHDDMDVLLNYGLKSWITHFLDFTTTAAASLTGKKASHIYVVCTTAACSAIANAKKQHQTQQNIFHQVVVVDEKYFPFSIHDLANAYHDKPTWIYQQLLKLYAYQVLSSGISVVDDVPTQNITIIPPIKQLFLVMDSDTVAVRPMFFLSSSNLRQIHSARSSLASSSRITMQQEQQQQQNHHRRRRPLYGIAGYETGTFLNDCTLGEALMSEVFSPPSPLSSSPSLRSDGNRNNTEFDDETKKKPKKAFPERNGRHFTAITHHMMFDGKILTEMLNTIERIHSDYRYDDVNARRIVDDNDIADTAASTTTTAPAIATTATNNNDGTTAHLPVPAWKIPSSLRSSVLSEWELYLGYVVNHPAHKHDIAVRPLSFVNWGSCDGAALRWLKEYTDIYLLSKHDDYKPDNLCCVNSNWTSDFAIGGCPCCHNDLCDRKKITCRVLGIEGCVDVVDEKAGELMVFL